MNRLQKIMSKLESFEGKFKKPDEEYRWPMGCTCKHHGSE